MTQPIEKAMSTLRESIHGDPEYAWSWHCNLAMSAYDEGLNHSAANRAAARFMQTCFGIDMTKHEHYNNTQDDRGKSYFGGEKQHGC